jgi:hypothetical protein
VSFMTSYYNDSVKLHVNVIIVLSWKNKVLHFTEISKTYANENSYNLKDFTMTFFLPLT